MKTFILVLLSVVCFSFAASAAMTHDQARRVLGVEKGADEKALKAARNRILKANHPDVSRSDATVPLMRAAVEAFDVLMTPESSADSAQAQASAENDPFPGMRSTFRRDGRPIPSGNTFSEFQFFTGYGEDFNPLERGGIHTTAQLGDFTLDEMLSRTGNYERFYSSLSQTVAKRLVEQGHPYFYTYARFWRFNVDLFKKYDWKLKAIFIASFALPFAEFMQNEDLGARIAAPPLALALHAVLVLHQKLVYQGYEVRQSNKDFAAFIREVNLRNKDSAKLMLLTYDTIETILMNQIFESPNESPRLFYSRMLKIMKQFPEAYVGFVLRARAGVGLAGKVKRQFEIDAKLRPWFWNEKIRAAGEILNRKNAPAQSASDDCGTLLAGNGL